MSVLVTLQATVTSTQYAQNSSDNLHSSDVVKTVDRQCNANRNNKRYWIFGDEYVQISVN